MLKKIDKAIRLIKSAARKADQAGDTLEICYSGGKDSDVILELAKMAGVKFDAVYKNTTIDPPGTIAHVKSKGVRILQPKKTFAQIIKSKGMPSRYRRHCCEFLNEYKVHEYAIVGVRRSESKKRANMYREPEKCRKYKKNEKVIQIFPILEWKDKDIEKFINDRNIKCHPLYYTNGVFHVERRLGCMCCPLQSQKKRIDQFRRYPGMVEFYVKNSQKFLDNHPYSKINSFFSDAREWLAFSLLSNSISDWKENYQRADLFGNIFDANVFFNTLIKKNTRSEQEDVFHILPL